MSRFASKKGAPGGGLGGSGPPEDTAFMGLYPVIWEYLTIDRFDSGEARRTSTLLAFIEDGGWKACLNDREGSRSLWVGGRTIALALDSLEALLAAGEGQWRQYQGYDAKGKKRG